MNESDRVRRLILKFLRLETIAEALYRQHLHAVPKTAKPLFQEFITVEERHRALFERYYQKMYGQKAPSFRFSVFCICVIAEILHLGGTRPIIAFECWIERLAIRDYEQALEWIEEPSMRTILHEILADEKNHPSLTEALIIFKQEEADHITQMQRWLTKTKESL